MFRHLSPIIAVATTFFALLIAAPCAAQLVDASEVFTITVEVQGKTLEMYCDAETLNAGRGKVRGDQVKFTPWSTLFQKFKKRGDKTKAKRFKQYRKVGNAGCQETDPGNGTPSPSPSASATATPTPSTGNFENDADGTCTDTGKTNFGIPTNLNATREAGKTIHENFGCDGCHDARVNYSFTSLRIELAKDPMFLTATEIPDDQLAHLACYMNRFQLP